MRVILAPVGSRGDVQPMLALARGLKAAGHDPAFSITRDFSDVVAREGFAFTAVDLDMQAVAQEMGSRLHNPFNFVAKARELLGQLEAAANEVADGADVVVGAGVQLLAPSVCEARNIPYVFTAYAPTMIRSRLHPPISVPWQGLSSGLNHFLWASHNAGANLMLRGAINDARRRLGLPAITDIWNMMVSRHPILGAFDGGIAAPPHDSGVNLRTTGFWFLDDATPLAPELEAFLSSGPPPVYIGFGSMPHTNPAELSANVLEAVGRAGVRAVIASGWSEVGRHGAVPDGCLVVNSANHGKLFGRVAAVVHHGGAGTTSAAARAGVPQFVVPHLMDQYYWGHRVHVRGLGPAPVPIGRLRAENLAAALAALVNDDKFRENARQAAPGLREGGGVAAAVKEIESVVERHGSAP